jgi:hypothetical protein
MGPLTLRQNGRAYLQVRCLPAAVGNCEISFGLLKWTKGYIESAPTVAESQYGYGVKIPHGATVKVRIFGKPGRGPLSATALRLLRQQHFQYLRGAVVDENQQPHMINYTPGIPEGQPGLFVARVVRQKLSR